MRDRLAPLWNQVRPVVRDLGTGFLLATGALSPDRRGRDRLTIVTFHRVLPAELRAAYPLPDLAVTPEELDGLLAFLVRHYTVGTLAELYGRWQRGERPVRPYLALTFDDTPWDNLAHAAPVLRRHGVHATFFAPAALVETGEALGHDRLAFAAARLARERGSTFLAQTVDEPSAADRAPEAAARQVVTASKQLEHARYLERLRRVETLAPNSVPDWARVMTWDELRTMAAAGHEIGSHSLNHPILPRCSDAQLREEIEASRALIETRLGRPVRTFCYPNGDWDDRALDAVARAGYQCAVTTEIGLNVLSEDARRLRRIDMRSHHFARRGSAISRGRTAYRLSGFARDRSLRLW